MVHAVVLVLGDLGRSPRMQYHASSLSRLPAIDSVTQIGYIGERVMYPDNVLVSEKRFAPWDFNFIRKVALLHAVLKGLGILIKVFIVLLTVRSYDVIIIQNPPCLPAVLAASFVSLFNGSTVVIDWHNLGFAMFEERLGKQHLLVRLAFQLERSICRLAHHHICVSRALKEWLAEHFSIQATVLYDRPAGLFVKEDPTVGQRHSLFVKLGYRDEVLFPTLIKSNVGVMADESDLLYTSTCQTSTMSSDSLGEDRTIENINVNLRIDRAKMVVSATSWTADEDFSILLDALQGLDQFLQSTNDIGVMREDKREQSVPSRVLVVVTGKGPLKAEFEAAVVDLNARGLLRYVAIKTAWLSADDYSLLLRCADLGICLHTSTSGLDLPMKVLDMFGSGLPVCAVNFPTLPELVKHGHNGLIFESALDLTAQLTQLLYPESKALRESVPTSSVVATEYDNTGQNGEEDENRAQVVSTYVTEDMKGSYQPIADNKNDYHSIDNLSGSTLHQLRKNAGEIESWEDNWNTVMKPLVQVWLE